MRELKQPRTIPRRPTGEANPIYFEIGIEGGGSRWWRTPNDRVLAELVTTMASLHTTPDDTTAQTFQGTICGMAAVVGASWWDPQFELDAKQPGPGGDWLSYGDAVIEELHEYGMSAASDVAVWAAELFQRYSNAWVGEDHSDFGVAQKDSETLPA